MITDPWRLLILAGLLFPATVLATDRVKVDTSAPGTAFDPGVRGQATPAVHIQRPQIANLKALDVARGSSIRGVVGGLEADITNWKTRNDDPRRTTLEYLKDSRDYNAELFITTNIRGLTERDPITGERRFYDTSIPTLTTLAADWVRYTNRIAQNYRMGDVVSDTTDQRILSELRWSSATPGDQWLPLLMPGDAAVPKVKYWEIGNEPRVPLKSSYGVSNSYTFYPPRFGEDETHKTDYAQRYQSMTAAMKAEDPTIKVGPCLQGPYNSTGNFTITEGEILDTVLKRQPNNTFLPVDFISYHPYQRMGDLSAANQPAEVTSVLNSVYTNQKGRVDVIRNRIAANGRDPDTIELVASEHFVSSHGYNEQVPEAQMAHALGTTETVFSYARLGLKAAHYWLWPTGNNDGTEYPVHKAYVGLRDHMGDTLLDTYSEGSNRLYTTRDSETGEIAVWGMNFENDIDGMLNLSLRALSGNEKITLLRLGDLSGDTTLASSNLATHMAGGPTLNVDWTSTDLTGTDLNQFRFHLPASTISLLLIQPSPAQAVPEPAAATIALLAAAALLRRRRPPPEFI